ncbi:MAG: hypothetical protein ACRDYZ_08470, partial [Acidimicrobiales bacterium]
MLIQQVVDEHGPARIRPPERRRKGGLFGFFSREVYVIAVDPAATEKAAAEQPSPAPETCATNPAGVAPASGRSIPPASLAALADETEDELSLGNGGAASAPSPWESPAPALTASAGTGSPSRIVKPFSQVLSEVASSLGEEPGTYRPDPEKLRRITPLVP